MSDFFEKPYSAEDLVGEANCGVFVLSGIDTIDTLPDIPCKYAMIASWTVGVTAARTVKTGAAAATEGSGTAGVEMYWGFKNKLFAQLFTGQRTEMLPVRNVNQICVKGAGTVFYAWFN